MNLWKGCLEGTTLTPSSFGFVRYAVMTSASFPHSSSRNVDLLIFRGFSIFSLMYSS